MTQINNLFGLQFYCHKKPFILHWITTMKRYGCSLIMKNGSPVSTMFGSLRSSKIDPTMLSLCFMRWSLTLIGIGVTDYAN